MEEYKKSPRKNEGCGCTSWVLGYERQPERGASHGVEQGTLFLFDLNDALGESFKLVHEIDVGEGRVVGNRCGRHTHLLVEYV